MLSNRLIAKFIDVIDQISIENHRNVPGLIMSSPGSGKTSTVERYCEYRDYNLTSLIASQYSQDDILGIQSVSHGKLVRLTPAWFDDLIERAKNGRRNVLFLDELTTCDEFIQAPLLNLISTGSLGLHKLPENTIIIAAGNYSEELNNVFSLTAPTVNRFLILNVSPEDYSMQEVMTSEFDKAQNGKVEGYFGLERGKEKIYKINKLKKFILKSYPFTPARVKNSTKVGLLGFISPRSLTNTMLFAEKYFEMYQDSNWVRVVGDTLGYIYSRGSDIPMYIRDNLNDNLGLFMGEDEEPIKKTTGKNLKSILMKFNNREDTKEDADNLRSYLKSNSLSEDDRSLIARVASFSPRLKSIIDEYEIK